MCHTYDESRLVIKTPHHPHPHDRAATHRTARYILYIVTNNTIYDTRLSFHPSDLLCRGWYSYEIMKYHNCIYFLVY